LQSGRKTWNEGEKLKARSVVLSLLVALMVTGECPAKPGRGESFPIDDEVVLVVFSISKGCPACDRLKPIVLALIGQDGFKVYWIDVTKRRKLARRHKIRAVPHLIMVVQGRAWEYTVGVRRRAYLLGWWKRAKERAEEE
jgi:thiol-disulfide isomerase/thioredoxin